MKKLFIYLAVIIVLFAVLYFINQQTEKSAYAHLNEPAQTLYNTTPDQLHTATRDQLTNDNYQQIILPDDLNEKLENEEDLFVYFFDPLCSFCVATTPVLNELADELDIEIYQFNLLEYNRGFSEYNLKSTPTLVYYENGVEKDRFVGGVVDEESRADLRVFLETVSNEE